MLHYCKNKRVVWQQILIQKERQLATCLHYHSPRVSLIAALWKTLMIIFVHKVLLLNQQILRNLLWEDSLQLFKHHNNVRLNALPQANLQQLRQLFLTFLWTMHVSRPLLIVRCLLQRKLSNKIAEHLIKIPKHLVILQ